MPPKKTTTAKSRATASKAKTTKKKTPQSKTQEFSSSGDELVTKIKKLIKEGNVRRIIIKNEKGKTVMEFPVTIAVVGTVLAPILAAVGALAAVLTSCTIVVKKK